jgi:hypothetical protein
MAGNRHYPALGQLQAALESEPESFKTQQHGPTQYARNRTLSPA